MSKLDFNLLNAVKICFGCDGKGCADCNSTGLLVDIDKIADAVAKSQNPESGGSGSLDGAVRPKIVCLCGSGRFREAFERAECDETLAGRIVLTIGCNTHDVSRSAELCHHKATLDWLHLRKIDLADEILVLNVGGYIGESTANEVRYASALNKPVRMLEPHIDDASRERINRK